MPDRSTVPTYTPFPSRLLDDVMPTLSDTEWRVLCIVVRSTFGWEEENGQRKQADWLTQAQLKARTGRASEALSRAIDGLVKKGLILVCNEAGEALATPQERRRCAGRMLFCMSPQALYVPQEASGGFVASTQAGATEMREGDQERGSSVSEEGCAQNEQSRSVSEPSYSVSEPSYSVSEPSYSVSEPSYSVSEPSYSVSEARYSVSEVRKAKTTKETKDKTTPDGVAPQKRADGDKPVDNSPIGRATVETDTASQRTGSDVQRFLVAYKELFQQHSARSEPPPMVWGRDGKLVKGLLAQYGYERLRELLGRFFASEDAWVKKRGYALACFPTLLPTLLMQDGRGNEVGRRASATPVVIPSPSAPLWQQIEDIKVSDTSLFERHPDLARRVRGQSP